jgi:two-component system phosphate regulon response regulator PhoB
MSDTVKTNILVVEDERDVRDLMMLHLKREGYKASAVENGEDGLKLLQGGGWDLVILDWMLPGVSGLEICKKIRSQEGEKGQLPVLMVTARADTADIVLGLEMGADDYITKPFEIPVFTARVRSLLRRGQPRAGGSSRQLEMGELRIDLDAHQTWAGQKKLELTPYEFKLLSALMENQGRVLSRDRLIEMVQGEGVAVVDRTIDTHVFGLRKKLGPIGDIIETIRGVGYRIGG